MRKSSVVRKTLINFKGHYSNSLINTDDCGVFNADVTHMALDSVYTKLKKQQWLHSTYELSPDANNYREIEEATQEALKRTLGLLMFLDSLQVNSLPVLNNAITHTGAKLCLTEQQSDEALHARAYQYIYASMFSEKERQEVSDYWRSLDALKARVLSASEWHESFYKQRHVMRGEDYLRIIFANLLLERVYFYNGFNFIYRLAQDGGFQSVKAIIKWINKDEILHTEVFVQLYNMLIKQYPSLLNSAVPMFEDMASKVLEAENKWSTFALVGVFEEFTNERLNTFTNFNINSLRRTLGFATKPVSNPFPLNDIVLGGSDNVLSGNNTRYEHSSLSSNTIADNDEPW